MCRIPAAITALNAGSILKCPHSPICPHSVSSLTDSPCLRCNISWYFSTHCRVSAMAGAPFIGTRAQKFSIGTIVVQTIVVLTMIGLTLHFVTESIEFSLTIYKTLPCYLVLFILAELFELLMALDALRLRNVIQLIGLLMFHLSLNIFAALQVHATKNVLVRLPNCDGSVSYTHCGGKHTLFKKVEPFLIVVPCVVATSFFALLWFVWALYVEFGWAIFRAVDASDTALKKYQLYPVSICLLKFEFFGFTGIAIQLLVVVLSRNSAEYRMTVAAIPVVLFLLIGCAYAVQRKIKWLMSISLVLMLASETYWSAFRLLSFDTGMYKLVRFYEPSFRQQYQTTRSTLTAFTIIASVLLLLAFAVGCLIVFDKDLLGSTIYGASSALGKRDFVEAACRRQHSERGRITRDQKGIECD
ncbi:hypothetical protein FA95DRAFT_1590059 [Auriscalpium vulgare]|uniref:Uncharacterized protein n=1 Tax=Auriscalpium vulgare TaxID=40419 RepID=A0ACB8RLD3_9AGAM|nr:hypothetical protein FA95DRAFT_1590059 [Auriscalpium vulgare]